MIQSQINRNIRLDLADAILLSKAKKDLSFAEIADGTGLAEAFVTAALLGQQALPADAARLVGAKLDLDEDSILLLQMIPLRGCIDDRIPTDPTMYRFYEMLQVYGTTLKADAPRDKCALSCAINDNQSAFHYLKKNYISGCVMTVPAG